MFKSAAVPSPPMPQSRPSNSFDKEWGSLTPTTPGETPGSDKGLPSPPPRGQSFEQRAAGMFVTPPPPEPVQTPITAGADLNQMSSAAAPNFAQRSGDMFGPSAPTAPSFAQRSGGMFVTSDKDSVPPPTSKTDHAFWDQVPGLNKRVGDPWSGMGE
jgi:hypothetical protein